MPGVKSRDAILISSMSIATFAILPLLNLIIMRFLDLGEGLLSTLYILSVAFIVFSVVMFNKTIIRPWATFWMLLLAFVVIFFLTKWAALPSTLKPFFFLICTLTAFIIPQLVDVDSKMMIRMMAGIPSIGILVLGDFFADDGSVKMNVTYAFLVPIVSALVYLFTYYKEDRGTVKLLMIVVIVINVVYFFMCLLYGSRAPSLSVVICLLFLLCVKLKQNQKGFLFKKNTWLYLVLPVIVMLNFSQFIMMAAELFNHFGWEADTLERLIALDEMGMLDAGRSEINILSMKGIVDSPLWGHGMSTSERITGYEYPHNFIFQILLDGGFILFFLIAIPFIVRLIEVKRNCSYGEFTVLTAFFFASVPAALFSMDLWENATFWLFMGFLFSRKFHISANSEKI